MEQRLSMVTLGVADLPRALQFYQDVVGWQAKPGPEGVAFFDLGGTVFCLYPHDALAKDMHTAAAIPPAPGYRPVVISHNARSAAEVDAIFARIESRGATILKAPEQVFWGGYSGHFADPDGHVWEVAYNPHWRIAADGRVTMPA